MARVRVHEGFENQGGPKKTDWQWISDRISGHGDLVPRL
jgi:hypothetical protein